MILNSYNNILVLAPHTDDGELGLGGTISKLIELGKKVTYVAFSTAQQSVPEGFPKDILKTEVKKATAQLGISPENLIIYNYEVRKLGYVRQEILEELIRLKKSNSFGLYPKPTRHSPGSYNDRPRRPTRLQKHDTAGLRVDLEQSDIQHTMFC